MNLSPAFNPGRAPKDDRRARHLETKLLALLQSAQTQDEIRKALPNCQKFFKALTSREFVCLLSTTKSAAVWIALYYHYGQTLHKAVNSCVLASMERMLLLYPLFRLYADESDTYI